MHADALFSNNADSAGGGIGGPAEAACQAMLDFVANGGGWPGNHASLVALARHKEFAAMVGGTLFNHPFTVRSGPSGSPFTTAFGDGLFPYVDGVFTVTRPFAPEKLCVLLSIECGATLKLERRNE